MILNKMDIYFYFTLLDLLNAVEYNILLVTLLHSKLS